MSNEGVDKDRRRVLTNATSALGAVGTAFAIVPFIASFAPSERAKALGAPAEADISKLEPGQRLTVKWRGKPVWIIRRTKEQLEALATMDEILADPASEMQQQPEYADNTSRAIKDEYAVLVGICTHLGCSPQFRPEIAPEDLGPDWKGGFFCPCHGSKFDLAGRVYKGVPAPTNLVVPPHSYASDTRVIIGVDQGAA